MYYRHSLAGCPATFAHGIAAPIGRTRAGLFSSPPCL